MHGERKRNEQYTRPDEYIKARLLKVSGCGYVVMDTVMYTFSLFKGNTILQGEQVHVYGRGPHSHVE